MDLFEHAERQAQEPTVVTVAALTEAISHRLAGLGTVAVEGEVSQPKRAASGHLYFDLAGDGSRISCAAWRSTVQRQRLQVEAGEKLVVHGRLDVYAPRGSYSLIVERVERRGIGQLLAQLERTKAELRELGWFDRKRRLPLLPRTVGVVTSRDGAGWQDFLRTMEQRWPDYPVRLAHARVQGQGSVGEVVRAIAALARSGVDLICVIRGGGSIEDLWTFNERPVAEAIFQCPVPVVTGVGHQTDTTLVDYVSDHRAHTPTDAAAVAIPDRAVFDERLERARAHLDRALEGVLEQRTQALARLATRPVLRDPRALLVPREREVSRLAAELRSAFEDVRGRATERLMAAERALARCSPARELERRALRLGHATSALHGAARTQLEVAERRLAVAGRSLEALSPLAVLERGYSITRDVATGRAVRSAEEVAAGTELETIVAKGRLRSRVSEDQPKGDA